MEKKLNLDIARGITEFEAYMKEFSIQRIMYRIIFKGKGLEFDGYRSYAPDDDAGDIDWKASMKSKQILIKQYIEERDLKIMFVVDVSDNMLFGSTEKLKCEYAAELSAALAHLILGYGDNIGFILFSDKIVTQALPKKGKRQFDIFVGELSNPSNYGHPSYIEENLGFLLDYLDTSINAVIIVSDFINLGENASRNLSFFSNKFETLAIMVKDPLDKRMPQVKGEVIIEDPNSKRQLIIDPSVVGNSYEKNALEQENKVKKVLSDARIDVLDLTTDKDFAPLLAEFLKDRLERRDYIVPSK
jgi:uncharacterized protein (DUF58 family)